MLYLLICTRGEYIIYIVNNKSNINVDSSADLLSLEKNFVNIVKLIYIILDAHFSRKKYCFH